MDELTEAQILTCKEYGKAKVYMINQDLFDTATDEQLLILDEQIKVRKDEWTVLVDSNKNLIGKLKEANIGDTNEVIQANLDKIKKEIADLEAKIDPFKTSGAKLVTVEELKKNADGLK